MRIVAVIQARTGSTRLPGKVLLDLAGEPMLARVMHRMGRASTLDDVVVATTNDARDDALVRLCKARGWLSFRGSIEDVLDRYFKASRHFRADAIVRVTSDCPLIDPAVVDSVVNTFLGHASSLDYVGNFVTDRTFPRGLDAEIFTMAALERAWREATHPACREHPDLYLLQHPELFRSANVVHHTDYSDRRWTVDTPDDLALVRSIYEHFGHDHFSWLDVLEAERQHPEWALINRHIHQKPVDATAA